MSGVAMRDSLRREVQRREAQLSELSEQRHTQRTDITRLDALIQRSEGAMVDLRKRYEAEVKNRNERCDVFLLALVLFGMKTLDFLKYSFLLNISVFLMSSI